MTPSEIQPGMKFGHWEVIKFDHVNEHRIKYFLCKCDVCGTTRPVRATALINGTSTACSKSCSSDITGLTFGNWQVLRKDPARKSYYICQCKCGTIRSVFGPTLKNGMSKSCGCLSHQHSKENNLKRAEAKIGKRYGLLTVIGVDSVKNEHYFYKCKCDCGNTCVVRGGNLTSETTMSCGCINSKANMRMDKILTKYNIPFKREYRFEDCRDKGCLPFDFALFNEQEELIGLIENNGAQHYSAVGTGWNTEEQLEITQKHDHIKQQFANKNHIPLLIIPYQYFKEDDMEKFLITSDFWKIITKNFND